MAPDVEKVLEGFDYGAGAVAVKRAQEFLPEIPPLNRMLLLYLIDLLAVFANNYDDNKMHVERLVSVFQPSILSGPPVAMDTDAYLVAARVLVFLVENADHFMIQIERNFKNNADSDEEKTTQDDGEAGQAEGEGAQ